MREVNAPLLKERTTLRLGGTAQIEFVLESLEDALALPEKLKKIDCAPICIGKGSNLLALDGDLPLALIKVADRQIKIIGQKNNQILVRAGAGASLASLSRFCIEHGFGGLEGLAGIPGSVGGAVAMNAGSFGCEVADVLHDVLALTAGELRRHGREDLKCGYRHTEFPAGNSETIILDATFALTAQSKNVIFTQSRLNFLEKKSKQPIHAWSAGCAFKNPAGNSAGKLLEQAGFRGKRYGGMAFSEKHANFLINEGNGTAEAALDFLDQAAQAVKQRFGIVLEKEVKIIPWPMP